MMIVTRPCDFCQVNYQAEQRYLNRGQGKFCSRTCAGMFRWKNKNIKTPNVSCAYCQIKFYKRPSQMQYSKSGLYFCSREHQSKGFSDLKIRESTGLPVTVGTCLTLDCSNRVRIKSSNLDDLICRACIKRDRIIKWLNGDISITWSGPNKNPKNFVKEYLIETRGDVCESCGFNTKSPTGGSIIQMDHIDGDYTNNLVTNLRLLCPNCHAMTDTYGSKNTGNGRKYRKKYYMSVAGLPTDSIEGA